MAAGHPNPGRYCCTQTCRQQPGADDVIMINEWHYLATGGKLPAFDKVEWVRRQLRATLAEEIAEEFKRIEKNFKNAAIARGDDAAGMKVDVDLSEEDGDEDEADWDEPVAKPESPFL